MLHFSSWLSFGSLSTTPSHCHARRRAGLSRARVCFEYIGKIPLFCTITNSSAHSPGAAFQHSSVHGGTTV